MLVLSRNVGQTLIIGEGEDQIVIAVSGVAGNQVRLGIVAPRHIPVHRSEIYERIQKEKEREKGEVNGNV